MSPNVRSHRETCAFDGVVKCIRLKCKFKRDRDREGSQHKTASIRYSIRAIKLKKRHCFASGGVHAQRERKFAWQPASH